MGVYLGQLPPAELARLKAELAETLIAHFCYPRFFDYRTSTLRTRPVDRAKRQEVWLYLSSIDFTAWNRVDLMSPEFQHQIERLLIHFVQRNRNFFGEQGRKRMSDIRMLISTSATSVVQGMRGHLTGQRQNNPPFGSPRPVFSWSTTNVTGQVERPWEQMLPATTLLQQQLQELRGEILPAPQSSEPQPPITVAARRNIAPAASVQPSTPVKASNGNRKSGSNGASQTPVPEIVARDTHYSVPPAVGNSPLPPVWQTISASNPDTLHTIDTAVTPVETPIVKPPPVSDAAVHGGAKATPPVKNQSQVQVPPSPMPERIQPQATIQPSPVPTSVPSALQVPPSPVARRMPPTPSSTAMQSRNMSPTISPSASTPPSPPAVAQQRESSPQPVNEEDIAIFEQMRHQLVVWLRVEIVRSGKDIAGQGPLQLLELLRQQNGIDETRLQVVSTLLNLSNQVIKNGHATLLDYKQALMFHLIHTGR